MKETQDNAGTSLFDDARSAGIDGRIFRAMAIATSIAVAGSALFAPWRITTGLLLGGVLALFNHRWLSRSTATALSVVAHGMKPRLGLAQYVLRYFVVAAVVFAAYMLNLVSLPATILGLCSFVAALFVEAFREAYFAFIHREETN